MQPLSSAARAPAVPNKPVGDGAEVINGEIVMWLDGRRAPVRPSTAWAEWLRLYDSPIPASQQRAKTIRAALDQIGYLQ